MKRLLIAGLSPYVAVLVLALGLLMVSDVSTRAATPCTITLRYTLSGGSTHTVTGVCGYSASTPTPTPSPTATPQPTATPPPGTYPWHTNITSTTFWVGEIFNANTTDGSQVCSTYDSQWALHWGGVNLGTTPASASGCPGSVYGSCDGSGVGVNCRTEQRTAANNYFPLTAHPLENPFYLDLPFDDINDSTAFRERCQVIPWASQPQYAGQCANSSFSYMKNRWVEITDVATGNTCYGQIEDAGPGQYHDATYVFGSTNARPASTQYNHAGLDVSPALNGCLGYKELDGENDSVNWRFVDSAPAGPWTIITTTHSDTLSGVP